MTVQAQQPFIEYAGDGVTLAFAYPFRILHEDHLQVLLSGVLQVAGYSITGADAPAGGTVVFVAPPALSVPVALVRRVPRDQQVDYQPFDAFPAETHERALDKLTMMEQEDSAASIDAVRVPDFERPKQRNMVLPRIEDRADLVLGFDELGNVIAVDIESLVVTNFVSDATGDAQVSVDLAWNAQANALLITRAPNEVIFYRWPGAATVIYRYDGNQTSAPWTTTPGDWHLSDTGAFIPTSEKGAVNGVATLDASGRVPASQLPPTAADPFPIGAMYLTATNLNPGTFLGGTWLQVGFGRVLIGVGTLGTDTYVEGATGGEARHQLTRAELPVDTIPVPPIAVPPQAISGTAAPQDFREGADTPNIVKGIVAPAFVSNLATFQAGFTAASAVSGTTSGGNTAPGATAPLGSGTPHENRQPFLAVYFWQRTA